jgi:hypothetical protein
VVVAKVESTILGWPTTNATNSLATYYLSFGHVKIEDTENSKFPTEKSEECKIIVSIKRVRILTEWTGMTVQVDWMSQGL